LSNGAPAVGVLVSGGLDSAILVGHLLSAGRRVTPFYVRSGLCWQEAELAALRRFLGALGSPQLESLVLLDLPLADVYGPHWSVTGRGVPAADSPDEAVYLPGRNALLLVKAAVWCRLHGIEELALGPLRTNPFADAAPEFFAAFEAALAQATGGPVRFSRPFAALDKREVMALGAALPLESTFSCLDPVDGLHCGRCNKCAERRTAFALVRRPDPTRYAAAG
jgi:7-cyano-7-deazaguanine synthase